MKYCEECKVNINSGLEHCPLCGSYVESDGDFELYIKSVEPYVEYPALKVKDREYRNFLQKRSALLLLLAAATALVLNILLTPTSLWSGYVISSCITLYFCAITSIYKKRRFYSIICVCAVVLPLYIVATELIALRDILGNFSGFGVSLEFIIPTLLFALIVLSDVLIFADKNKYYLITMCLVSTLSLVPQLLLWTAFRQLIDWFSFTLFFFALFNSSVIIVLKWKQIKEEFKKKFFM